MPRKKAFSAKQKKEQLQDRRKRKEGGPQYARNFDVDCGNDLNATKEKDGEENTLNPNGIQDLSIKSTNFNINKVNQQPFHKSDKYDPNKYRLHFFKENADIIQKRKEKAYQPYQILPEVSLELHVEVAEDEVIDIPKRPAWDYKLSKQRLEANENRYFKEYVDEIFSKHEAESLSFFDLNLETWRQLWRVLEMSDIFLLITDIRHPMMHFPPALYTYITEVLKKDIVLILNKIDLAPPSLVTAWQHYFKSRFPLLNIVCFTSFPKTKEELEGVSDGIGKVIFKKRKRGTYRAVGPKELLNVCVDLIQDKVDLSSWKTKIDVDQGCHDDDDENDAGAVYCNTNEEHDYSHHNDERFHNGILTIGCIGYPNVGKSSVLNGLMGKKVVSVSKTPGHTKHFQTIYLTQSVRLCDCPGLVFPSKWNRTLQVLAGIYPISQIREPYSIIEFLAQRSDLPKLLKVKHPEDDGGCGMSWTAMDICYAWAEKKGFLTAKAARADTYRAANNILSMTVDGRLCLCFYPPFFTQSKEKWKTHQDTLDLIELQHNYRQKIQASADSELEDAGTRSEEDQMDEDGEPVMITSKNPFELLGDDE